MKNMYTIEALNILKIFQDKLFLLLTILYTNTL